MERIDRRVWEKHLRPNDMAALAIVLSISVVIVVILIALLF